MQAVAAAVEGDEAQPVGQHLVLDHRRVVLDVDVLDGQRRDLGDEDAPEGVGEGGVEADERKGREVGLVLVEAHREAGSEAVNRKGQVLARVVARVVCRRHVGDGFEVDANRLHVKHPEVSLLDRLLGSSFRRRRRRRRRAKHHRRARR